MTLRLDGLDGFTTNQGPTFNGGWFVGGGPIRQRSLTVRTLTPMGDTASVELDLTDHDHHGCSVSLSPENARKVAGALMASADEADAELAHQYALRRAGMNESTATATTATPLQVVDVAQVDEEVVRLRLRLRRFQRRRRLARAQNSRRDTTATVVDRVTAWVYRKIS